MSKKAKTVSYVFQVIKGNNGKTAVRYVLKSRYIDITLKRWKEAQKNSIRKRKIGINNPYAQDWRLTFKKK